MQDNRRTDTDFLEGRKDILKDSDELKVVVPLRDQVIKKLVKKLEDEGEGRRTSDLWMQANAERLDWMTKQQELLRHFDEFIEPIYSAAADWSSTLHLPTILTMCKTMHARFLAALLGVDPPFTAKSRTSANTDRAQLIQEFMRYTLQSWVNKNQGVEEVVDSWIWCWVTSGRGWLKNRWERSFTRYMDVEQVQEPTGVVMTMPDEAGNLQVVPQMEMVEKEIPRVINTFDGPMMEFVPNEDLILIGGVDAQEADHVLHSSYLTASQMWQLVDQGVFREEAVKEAIRHGESLRSADPSTAIKDQQTFSAGSGSLDNTMDELRYQVIERHSRIVVDNSGIASDIIMWVHRESGEILRATYLYRVSKTGLRPFFSIDFHRRQNGMPVGLPEMIYSIAKEIDAVHNMKMDFGLISSMPFGFYRATSSMAEERIPFEPGMMMPIDNPQSDVYFPNLGARHGFTAQEEQILYQQIERLTSISDMSLGVIGGQGAARTATGARALLGESNGNLDVFLRRMNRGWKRAITHLFHMLQERTPDGMQFRVLGDDGNTYWETVKSREELSGMFDFELEANSSNSNKQIQIEVANSILQTIANPFFIQLGIVGPANLFAALKNKMQVEGIKDWSRYISKPQGSMQIFTPIEIADMTLHGIDVRLGPEQDLQGFLEWFEYALKHDEILGQWNEGQTIKLAMKAQEAQQMLEAAQAQAAQVANSQQMQMNATQGAATPQGQGMAQASPEAMPQQ